MNDLNLLVSHALTAVRDAQQSVRDGDLGAGEAIQPLLADFSEVMQGLIALAQTAPQTEDAFETAKTAMLQNLAQAEDELDVFGADLASTQEAENDDSALAPLQDDDASVDESLIPSPLAAAFVPLQETIAAMLLTPVALPATAMANNPQTGDMTAGAALQGAQAGVAMPASSTQAQQEAQALQDAGKQGDQNAQAAQTASELADQAAKQAAAQDAAQNAMDATRSQTSATSAGQEAQPAQPNGATLPGATQGTSAVSNGAAPSQATDASMQGAQASDNAPSKAIGAAASPAGATKTAQAISQADTVHIQDPSQAPQQSGTNTAASPDAQALTAAQLAQTAATAPSEATKAEAKPSADGIDAEPSADAAMTDAQRLAAASASGHGQEASGQHGAGNEGGAPRGDAQARGMQGAQAMRPGSTVAERQAARHMQNYQQAANEQAAAGAPTLEAGPTATQSAPSAAGAAQFVPAAAVPMAPAADTPQTVHLPAVSLPDLPADLSNAMAAGAKRVRIEINPPSLGSVEVGVQMRDGAVFVSMQAENASVAQHIERHVQDLRAHLKEAGLSLGGFETSARGDEAQQHAQQHAEQFGHASQERLWSDDMLKLAVDQGGSPLSVEDIAQPPSLSQQRPGSINVVA